MALTVSQGQVSLAACTEDDTDVTVAKQGTVDRLRRGNHLWRFVPGATPAIRSVGLQTGRRWRRRWDGLAVGAITARVNGWVQPRRVVCNAKQLSHRSRQSGAAVQHAGNTQAGSRDGALTRWVPPFRRRARVACFHLSRQKDAGRCPHRPCVVRLQAAGAVAIFGAALDLWCRRRATDDTRRYLLAHSGISATAVRPEG